MPDIQISDPLYRRLLRRSTSFDDTAEDVIQRLLDQTDGAEGTETFSHADQRRASPGSILPEREYWRPILSVIADAGGSAAANDVIDALEERMGSMFRPRDLEPLRTGSLRWRNRARFARLRMREAGLLSDESQRGLWEITDAGREYLTKTSPAIIQRMS